MVFQRRLCAAKGHTGKGRRSFPLRLEHLEDRLAPNAGALDASFGTGGIAFGPWLKAAAGQPRAIAIQTDGKILVLGFLGNMERFNSDGSLDVTFGMGG